MNAPEPDPAEQIPVPVPMQVEPVEPVEPDKIEVAPLPAAAVRGPKNLVVSDCGLRKIPAKSYKGMVARVGPRNFTEAMRSEIAEKWNVATDAEMRSIKKHNTCDLVLLPKGGKIVDTRWVLHVKDGDIYKARFCAKGYTQRWGVDYEETFAPVAKYTSIRTLIALAAGGNFEIHQMDVITAFLNSNLEETVYVRQPEGY